MKDNLNKNIDNFPTTHIKPYDGMAITADVWEEAHEEHRQARRSHDLVFHGAGIVYGLEVEANDPSDQIVFISPGLAIDSAGNLITLKERIAYDFGKASNGILYLVLGHGSREVGGVEKEVRYLKDEFVLAARSNIPKRPYVELARINLKKTGNKVKDAKDFNFPQADELDLRYRKMVKTNAKNHIAVGIGNIGGMDSNTMIGWGHLSKEIERASDYKIITDSISLSPEIMNYGIIYLGCSGPFELKKDELLSLQKYLKQKKYLILDALNEETVESCKNLLTKIKYKQSKIKSNSKILTDPYMFTVPPTGNFGNKVFVNKNVIYSACGYGLSWAGSFAEKNTTRADIRSSHEWGTNIIMYCINNSSE